MKLFLASSNPGKLREYRELAGDAAVELDLVPNFRDIPAFEETAPTFSENSAGKALHYSKFSGELVLADDSGLVVPALGGAPGVYSARYAGPDATDADRVRKLLREMEGKNGDDRRARFICVTTCSAPSAPSSSCTSSKAARWPSFPIARKARSPPSPAERADSATIRSSILRA